MGTCKLYAWPESYGEFTTDLMELEGEYEVEIVGFADPTTLFHLYSYEVIQKNIVHQTSEYGCDEVRDMVVRLNMNGEEWYQCMLVGCYGEKWYNIKFLGNSGILLGICSFASSLALAN